MKQKQYRQLAAVSLPLGMVLTALLCSIASGGDPALSRSLSDADTLGGSPAVQMQMENLRRLQADLSSGKPTLAFFYYSVACSCTAARCAIAQAAIDSISALIGHEDSLNVVRIDAYLVPAAESLFNIMIIPAIIYFNNEGKEINRLEWGTSRQAIKLIIEHPEVKQPPVD
jgi:hypothetical protein